MTKQIDYIMGHFDFEKVHDVMEFLNWDWFNMGVPSIHQLKVEAEGLMLKLISGNNRRIACGGFEAVKRGNGDISLYFIVEEWDGII